GFQPASFCERGGLSPARCRYTANPDPRPARYRSAAISITPRAAGTTRIPILAPRATANRAISIASRGGRS
ncbi:hypothetical protein, partial [Nitrolancea hollandica]|uniref:hypothetical protein n=1 Tax=Nitrolancea hollandica TaxID=1206749 RepID=UPI001EE66B33